MHVNSSTAEEEDVYAQVDFVQSSKFPRTMGR